ncbi:hypothetical protein PG984_006641 [Apiospora sp. TS-2023a]
MEALTTRCAESIALLHLLHYVPRQPASNSLKHLPTYKEGYTLSFEQERRLSGVLAFLSSIRNDPNYIPAVCLQETNTSSLDVFFAVNKGRHVDGNDVLRELEHGFKNLFAVLSQVSQAREDRMRVEHEAFAAIISMCSARILNRLRLKEFEGQPVRNGRNASVKASIEKVLKDIRSSLQANKLSTILSRFMDTFGPVIRLIDSWSKHQTQPELEALVEGLRCLQQTKDVGSVLASIPESLMFPQSKRSLLNMISKVARYRECARFLCHLAAKQPLLRKMTVVPVQLGSEAFRRTPVAQLAPNLASKMSPKLPQMKTRKKAKKAKEANLYSVENACRLLDTTVSQATKAFAQQTRRTLKEGKVHAEIQLLFHFEQSKPDFPPRVVCSSKDACFLCNTFILMHGKMHTPRSHGRLYPGWRLPHAGSTDLHSKFVERLDGLAKGSLETLFYRGTKTLYPEPNESTLLTLLGSASTLLSRVTHHSATQSLRNLPPPLPLPPLEAVEEVVAEPIKTTAESPKVSSAGARSDGEPAATTVETTTTKNVPEANEERLSRDASPISPLSDLLSSMSVHDDDQTPCSVQLSETVGANGTSPFYSDGVLEVQVEYSAGEAASGGLLKQLPFSIEWLSGVEEADRVGEIRAQPVFDADSSETEISLPLNCQNSVYILAKGSLAKLTFGRPQVG